MSGKFWAVIAAGGKGLRFGGKMPKQFMELGGETVLARAVRTVSSAEGFAGAAVVVPSGFEEDAMSVLASGVMADEAPYVVVTGGEDRQSSVWRGLCALDSLWVDEDDVVAVHDAARPLVTADEFAETVAAADRYGAAFLGVKPADTIKVEDDNGEFTTIERGKVVCAGTPQAFKFGLIRRAHERFVGENACDDCFLAEKEGLRAVCVEGGKTGFKITEPVDFRLAEILLQEQGTI